jgi:hypothetical protein
MEFEWRSIRDFPGYEVSEAGSVRNMETGRVMSLLVNQRGIVNVGLTRNLKQYKRSVSLLVAESFIPVRPGQNFNTPINLDGDRFNNSVANLMWRPRWFATEYFRQFITGPVGFTRPIQELGTKERFETSWEAALKFGLLDYEILQATMNRTYVWPTYQRFRVIHE